MTLLNNVDVDDMETKVIAMIIMVIGIRITLITPHKGFPKGCRLI